MRTYFILFLLFLNGKVFFAQTELLSLSEVKEDTDIFISALQEAHPGMDIYLSSSQVDSIFDECSKNLDAFTLREFYLHLSGVMAAIQDGHTDLRSGTLYKTVYPFFENTLPFEIKLLNEKAYIIYNHSDNKDIPLYSEIIEINQIPTEQIIQKLFDITPADGGSSVFKERYNEKIFGRLYPKLFGPTEHYTITLKQPDQFIKKVIVSGISDDIIHQQKEEPPLLSLNLNKDTHTAILTVRTFQYGWMAKNGFDFHRFLKKSFRSIKKNKIKHLIIDLRDNYGGDNILAVTLYSYLTQGEFKAMNPSITKLKDTFSFSTYSNFPKGNYPFMRNHQLTEIDSGLFELSEGIDSKAIFDSDYIYKGPKSKPENISKLKFTGQVYCLTSGLTFSAAANFATLLSRNENATFIGEETGGSSGTFCGGGFYLVTLPNSQFRLQIPFMRRSVYQSSPSQQGIQPDYTVLQSIQTIQSEEDPVLLKAKDLIREASKKE